MHRFNRQTAILGVLLALLFSGCASFPGKREAEYKPGSILVFPPRDVVQNGSPHPKGVDSGDILLDHLVNGLARTPFKPLYTSNPAFTPLIIASKEEALTEARALKADYYLQLVLGEFLDAAPMTNRPDHVTLEQAAMYETRTGSVVWRLTEPAYFEKSNSGSYTPLLEFVARQVVESITGR